MSRTWPKHNHEFVTLQKRAIARAQIYKNEDPIQANKENDHGKQTMIALKKIRKP